MRRKLVAMVIALASMLGVLTVFAGQAGANQVNYWVLAAHRSCLVSQTFYYTDHRMNISVWCYSDSSAGIGQGPLVGVMSVNLGDSFYADLFHGNGAGTVPARLTIRESTNAPYSNIYPVCGVNPTCTLYGETPGFHYPIGDAWWHSSYMYFYDGPGYYQNSAADFFIW